MLKEDSLNCRVSMSILTASLAVSAVLYLVAKILSHKQPDYRQREQPEGESPEEQREPLLVEEPL